MSEAKEPAEQASKPYCQNCRHWQEYLTDDFNGQCRRRAPAAWIFTGSQAADPPERIEAAWPTTFCEDWCGDWQESAPK